MLRGRPLVLGLALLLGFGLSVNPAAAQGWTADLYAGATRAQGVATQVTSTSMVGNLRYQNLAGLYGYAALGAPLGDNAALWGAAGFGGRVQRTLTGPLAFGAEAALDGYAYDDRTSDTTGRGSAFHVVPFLSVGRPGAALEGRAGVHQRNANGSLRVWELGSRATASGAAFATIADVRWLRADSVDYSYAGAQAIRVFGPVRAWASAGRWLEPLDQTAWEIGASVNARLVEVWASVRQEATDPLYSNPMRRSWNVGISRPLGRGRGTLPPPVVDASGRVRITLADDAVPGGSSGGLRIAGEFNRWMPAPMTRSGDGWVLELPLGSGVYRFAFVTAGGEWFVPDRYPGRISDDMGGYVAVLVVP